MPGGVSLPAVRRIATTLIAIGGGGDFSPRTTKSLNARIKMFVEKPEFDREPG
jgi:hypothetical protein